MSVFVNFDTLQIKNVSDLNTGWLEGLIDDLMVNYGYTNQQIMSMILNPNEHFHTQIALHLGRIGEWRAYVQRVVRSRRSRYWALKKLAMNSRPDPYMRVGERLVRLYALNPKYSEQLASAYRDYLQKQLLLLGAQITLADCGDAEVRARPILESDIAYRKAVAFEHAKREARKLAVRMLAEASV